MMENSDLTAQWEEVESMLTERFGKTPNLETILFLIGIQELGQVRKKFTKEQKEDLMHIAMCTILSPDGYYHLEKYDEEGWPHFKEMKKVHGMKLEEQEHFLKQHIIAYFRTHHNLTRVDLHGVHH